MFVENKRMARIPRAGTSLGIVQKSQLIECVRQHVCIWDIQDDSFKSSSARQNAFIEIAEAMSDYQNHYTRTQMQEEWGKIRYCFTRIVKKFLSTEDDSEAVSWPYWQKMQFMYETIKEHLLRNSSSSDMSYNSSNDLSGQLKRNGAGRRKRFSHLARFNPEPLNPSMSPNLLMASNVLAAINSQNLLQNHPTQQHQSGTSSPYSRVFGMADRDEDDEEGVEDHLLLLKHTKEEEESSPKRPKPAMETPLMSNGQMSESLATRQFLSSMNSSPFSIPLNGQSKATTTRECQSEAPTSTNNNSVTEQSNTNEKSERGAVDTSEYFGKYMVQQMQAVSKQNPTLGIHLRKELMEVICKYELKAFTSSTQ